MKKNSRSNSLVSAAVALLAPCVIEAQVYPLSENSWDNPEFVERFMGSYGFATEKDPGITREEKEVFDQIVPLVQSSPTSAIALLRQEVTPESSAAFDLVLANLLFQQGDLRPAITSYENALRKFPNFYRAYFNLGRVYVQLGDYPNALTNLLKAIELGGGSGDLYGLVGYCYLNDGQDAVALDAYRMAILFDPDSVDWKNGKLRTLLNMGMLEEAIPMLYDLLEDNPEDSNFWVAQSNAFLQTDRPGYAAANLEILRAMGEADSRMLAQLGGIYVNEGLPELALAAFSQALDAGGYPLNRIVTIAEQLIGLGNLDEASVLIDKIESSYDVIPDDTELQLLNARASVALAKDDDASAAELLQQVVDRDPLNGRALLLLSDFHYGQEAYADAIVYAEQATKVDATQADALLKLGRIYVAQGEFGEAAQYIRRSNDLEPRDYVGDYLVRVERAARASDQL